MARQLLQHVVEKTNAGIFSGIKMYPALGYWPFARELKAVYDHCLEKQLPIMSHCVAGLVHDRGKKQYETLPICPDVRLEGKKAKHFSIHFSNPLAWHCVMEPSLLAPYWNISKEEADKYSKLKVCLAHFGGGGQWMRYIRDPWYPNADNTGDNEYPSLKKENWNFKLKSRKSDY
jgi:hypothetical protein